MNGRSHHFLCCYIGLILWSGLTLLTVCHTRVKYMKRRHTQECGALFTLPFPNIAHPSYKMLTLSVNSFRVEVKTHALLTAFTRLL